MLHKKVRESKMKCTVKAKSDDIDKIAIRMRCVQTHKNEYEEELTAEKVKKIEDQQKKDSKDPN
jgi:hypothetical protein